MGRNLPGKAMPVPPIVLSMLLCDAVHRDADTGKFYLLGSSNFRRFPSFPARSSAAQLFLSLVEVNGSYDLCVRIVDVNEEDDPIFETRGQLVGYKPLSYYEFTIPLPGVEFPHAGEFFLQLVIGGETVAERRLVVLRREEVDDE
jgi:hypothetical protein